MANIKFFKKATRPTSAGVGSVWFDSTRKAIVLTGATAAEDVIYSGCITNAVVNGEKLILTKTDGTNIEVDFAVFATDAALSAALTPINNSLGGKQDKTDNTLATTDKTVSGAINEINTKVSNLTGALTWKGKFDTLPAVTNYEAGNVIGVGNKEYVLTVTGSTKAWEELGDEGSYLLKSVAEETYAKKTSIPTVNDPKVSIKMNGAEKGSFTLNQASAGEVDLGTVITAHQDISGKVDKTTLLNTLMVVDLSSGDIAVRKAKLDKFEADWKKLTGADDLDGARFVGKFVITEDVERNVTGIMTYCAGDDVSDTTDNCFYGICNGYSFGEQKSQIAVKVSCTDGSLTITPLFSHLEAITIKPGNTTADKAANAAAIKAYVDNLETLGVDTTKGFSIPVYVDGMSSGFLCRMGGNIIFYMGFVNSYGASCFGISVDSIGTCSMYKLQTETDNSLKTVSKHIVGAINEVNTLAKKKQDILTSGTNIKTINNQSILGSGNINITGGVTKCRINVNTLVAEPTGNEPIIFKMPLSDVQKYKNYDVVEIYSAENGVETTMYTVYHGAFSEFYATSNGTEWLTGMFIGDETTTDENKIGFELIISKTVDTVDKDAKKPISSSAVYNALQGKQDKLTSGTNIKTINNQSLLGSGNIKISAPSITVDTTMSDTSTNPVQNKVIKAYIDGLVGNVAAWIEYE